MISLVCVGASVYGYAFRIGCLGTALFCRNTLTFIITILVERERERERGERESKLVFLRPVNQCGYIKIR